MKRYNTADKTTARNLAGLTTERAAWKLALDLATQLVSLHDEGKAHGGISLDDITVEGSSFTLGTATKNAQQASAADDVWQLGSCVYELIAGNEPFGGKGRVGQEAHSPMPVFSSYKASAALSELTARCMAFNPQERITAKDVADIAAEELVRHEQYCADREHLKYLKPQNRCIRMKTYDFWPEAMVSLLLLFMMAFPQHVFGQSNAEFDKLIRLTTTMRDQTKRAQVLKELKADDKWTLMDELRVDLNECSYGDKVRMFGVNDIAIEIAQYEKGIINVGGRFKHSADGKHHYSFVELTARAGKTISYNVRGHKGEQQIVVIPFDAKSNYSATFRTDGKTVTAHTVKDGMSYFTVGVGQRGNYEFSITNNDKKNASYVVITYNPMK